MTIASGPMPRWRSQPLARFNRASPNLRLIDAHLADRWQFFFNGSYVVRNIRGGKSKSIHSWGAAIDSSWSHSDRGRCLDAIEWLIDNSEELHVSSIHDYGGSRIWHQDRQAWKRYNGQGTPNGTWIHYETTIDGWGDATPIADRLGGGMGAGRNSSNLSDGLPLSNAFPPFDPAAALFSLWPLNPHKPTLRRRAHRSADVHDATLYLQGVMTHTGRPVEIDGIFGDKTTAVVEQFQTDSGLKSDGLVGPKTWQNVDGQA